MKYKRKIIGLTGSIAMGKSYIANIFTSMNIAVFDADKEIKKLFLKPEVIKKISLIFPECLINQKLNTAILAEKVFANKSQLNKLESILYPYLNKGINKFINSNSNIIVIDIPLLFEKNYHIKFDEIITVSTSKYTQTKRVLKRSNMTKEKLNNILKNQFSDSKKKLRSNHIIYTGGSKASCIKQVKNILYDIQNYELNNYA
ncbi:MAG: dephospho-CoA kinase [Alphaproteobacteria bacterium]